MSEEITTVIKCDQCGAEHKVEAYPQGLAHLHNIDVRYFQCPDCGHRYPFLLEDDEQRQLHSNMQNVRANIEFRRQHNKDVSSAQLRLLTRLIEKAQAHQSILRDIYLKAVTDQLDKSDFTETNS